MDTYNNINISEKITIRRYLYYLILDKILLSVFCFIYLLLLPYIKNSYTELVFLVVIISLIGQLIILFVSKYDKIKEFINKIYTSWIYFAIIYVLSFIVNFGIMTVVLNLSIVQLFWLVAIVVMLPKIGYSINNDGEIERRIKFV